MQARRPAHLSTLTPCPPPSPARLRHGGSEIILFRDNLQQKMRGLAILPPPAGDEAPLFEHVAATVLQQSHLCPVPLEFQVGGWVVTGCGAAFPRQLRSHWLMSGQQTRWLPVKW